MGLFGPTLDFGNAVPIEGILNWDRAMEILSSTKGSLVDDRNKLANSLLAGAQKEGKSHYREMKSWVISNELTIFAQNFSTLFPNFSGVTEDKSMALGIALIADFLRVITKSRDLQQMQSRLLGPNIPQIIDAAYQQMIAGLIAALNKDAESSTATPTFIAE